MDNEKKCPFSGKAHTGTSNREWWPNQLDLSVLHVNPPAADPMGTDFDYAKEFKTLDLDALKKDIEAVMTTSQEWWPADYGHYGPLFIRMAWHARSIGPRCSQGARRRRSASSNPRRCRACCPRIWMARGCPHQARQTTSSGSPIPRI